MLGIDTHDPASQVAAWSDKTSERKFLSFEAMPLHVSSVF